MKSLRPRNRNGAVIPLFAALLPVLVLLSAYAINVSYMQLTRAELRVATDAAARAGGRAWSEYQTISEAKNYACFAAERNFVAGDPLNLRRQNARNEIEFGLSRRRSNGYGRYEFDKANTQAVANGSSNATSIRVTGTRTQGSLGGAVQLLMGGVGDTSIFQPTATAICTQVDRDIALVLDISGSMAFHEDTPVKSWNDLFTWVNQQLNAAKRNGGYNGKTGKWEDRSWRKEYFAMRKYKTKLLDYYKNVPFYRNGIPKPDATIPFPSRWSNVVTAVNKFLDVLEETDQEERVSLGAFHSSGMIVADLQTNYNVVRSKLDDLWPWGGTAIDSGLNESLHSLYGALGRPYAAKTIVVLTDGFNNKGSNAVTDAVRKIIQVNNVTIHSVSLSVGSDQNTMKAIADIGNGKHYHAATGDDVVRVFEDIANNLPTIITE